MTLIAPLEERQGRMAACENCPSRQGKICGECGCYIKMKVTFTGQTCPLGNWPVPLPAEPTNKGNS